MDRVITNCVVTNSNSKVIREYVDSSSDKLYKVYKGYSSGIEIEASHVYSLCSGIVVQVGRDNNKYVITIAHDDSNLVSYCLVTKPEVSANYNVSIGDFLGYCNKSVRVEYLTTTKSRWPVRIGSSTYYKNDPSNILENPTSSFSTYSTNYIYDSMEDAYAATEPFTSENSISLVGL